MSELTPEQSAAALKVQEFISRRSIHGDDWMMSISGFAGTGKTFLMQTLINDGVHPKIICCAPTGKAAAVLKSKLKGVEVWTIHQALYTPLNQNLSALDSLQASLLSLPEDSPERVKILREIDREKKRLAGEDVQFTLRENSRISPGSLVIIDEASMVSPRILEDLKKTGAKVIFVGDSGQLPPVEGENWFMKRKHDASLISIQRQAKDSPIIRLSFQIREGCVNREEFEDINGDCRLVHKSVVAPEEWAAADQILTGRNESRQRINRFIRRRRGYGDFMDPYAGEKLICLKNDWNARPQLINGVLFESLSEATMGQTDMVMDIRYEGVELLSVPYYSFHTRSHYVRSITPEPPELRRGLFELDYGYCITVHKSQGSEWDSVIIADDRMQESDKKFRQKWLYTAVTRASKKLTIVQQ